MSKKRGAAPAVVDIAPNKKQRLDGQTDGHVETALTSQDLHSLLAFSQDAANVRASKSCHYFSNQEVTDTYRYSQTQRVP